MIRTFIKAQAASVLGSLADYLVTILLTETFGCWYLTASFSGNITGGIIQFILLKKWAFGKARNRWSMRVFRFILVFAGNLILSAAAIYSMTNIWHIHYIISKTIVSIILGITFNFVLQKNYVFAN